MPWQHISPVLPGAKGHLHKLFDCDSNGNECACQEQLSEQLECHRFSTIFRLQIVDCGLTHIKGAGSNIKTI
jgi:hypothetical protein